LGVLNIIEVNFRFEILMCSSF